MSSRQMSERRPKPQNVPSRLLNNDENDAIFTIIGNKCVSLGTAVAQVFLADHTSGNSRRWNKRCTGVLTFIKDNENKSYYLRVYNMKYKNLDWQQELYNNFKYKEPRDQFHTFEADTCSAGLSFANVDEAREFAKVVNEKIKERIIKRRTKKRQTQMAVGAGGQPMSISGPQTTLPATPAPAPAVITPPKAGKNNKNKGKAKKITKDDISVPSDFRHVNHIGWHPNSGFDINNLDPDMKSLFDKAGISKEALEDDETRKQIYDVIEQQGGLDAIKQQVNTRPPPPAPSPTGNRGVQSRELPPPPPSRHGSSQPPPPPPSRELPSVPFAGGQPPPPPNRNRSKPPTVGPPPPPPPSGRVRAAGLPPPPPHQPSAGFSAPPPPPPAGVPAPPPPPPPAPSGGPPPPPPVGRSNLLADIQSGKKLQKAAPSQAPPARDALLDAIKKGRDLKHIDPSKEDHSPPPSEAAAGGGLLDALMNVMASRNQAINPSDDSDEDEDDDDDWDEDE